MSPEMMENAAEGYTFGSIVSWLGTIGCGVGFVEAPEHHGWLVATIGLGVLAIVASVRRTKLLKEAERARAMEKSGL